MVNIVFTDKNKVIQLDVKGHADYEEKGKDIVCSAVSTLLCSYARAVIGLKKSLTSLFSEPVVELEDGDAHIMVNLNAKEENSDAYLLYAYISGVISVIIGGLKLVSDNYKDNVSLTIDSDSSAIIV